MKTTTPFKIHDENEVLTVRKGTGKQLGLGTKLEPTGAKKGLNTEVKSTRKALSNISTNQSNVLRTTTPASVEGRPLKVRIQSASSSTHADPTASSSKSTSKTYYVDDFTEVN